MMYHNRNQQTATFPFVGVLLLCLSFGNHEQRFASASSIPITDNHQHDNNNINSRDLSVGSFDSLWIAWKCGTEFTPAPDAICDPLLQQIDATAASQCNCFAFCNGQSAGCLKWEETGEFQCGDFSQSKLCRIDEEQNEDTTTNNNQPPPQQQQLQDEESTEAPQEEDTDALILTPILVVTEDEGDTTTNTTNTTFSGNTITEEGRIFVEEKDVSSSAQATANVKGEELWLEADDTDADEEAFTSSSSSSSQASSPESSSSSLSQSAALRHTPVKYAGMILMISMLSYTYFL